MSKARLGMWTVLLALAAWASWLAVGMVGSLHTHPIRMSAVLYVGQKSEQGVYSVVGSATISASFIDRVLSAYRSPAAGLGSVIEGQGMRYGIDPVYALAFFWHESGFGTTGEARVTLSPGNERCLQDRPCIDQERGGYAQMRSWADGFEHWYSLILNLYVRQWGRVTVAQIIPKYAPSSDGNDEAAYIAAVEHAVDVWRSGQVWV
jgi:hypothetical protein